MKTYEEVTAKPSILMRYMYEGLVKVLNLESNLYINMETFGMPCNSIDDTCFGCAATAALQEALDFRITGYRCGMTSRMTLSGLSMSELEALEGALDYARQGYGSSLFTLCGIPNGGDQQYQYFDRLQENPLTTHRWSERLPVLLEVVEHLERDGL